MTVRKAVFPAAGLGTRFLPATKASPKEMLSLVDKPLIQYAVEEAVASGIEDIIIITGRGKRAIEDHFDRSFELEENLRSNGKLDLLKEVEGISQLANFCYVRQAEARGLGHAVLCAQHLIGDEPFAVVLPDVLVQSKRGCLAQMIDAYAKLKTKANIIAVEEVPMERVHMYGIVGVGKGSGAAMPITQMVEKPKRENAPSNLSITGRYILQPEIFSILENQQTGAGGEIQLTDAMIALAKSQPFYAVKFEGRSYDCGSKLGFLTANVAYALKRKDIADELREELQGLLS